MNQSMLEAQTMERLRRFGIGLVVVGVVLTIGLKVTTDVGDAMTLDEVVTDEKHAPSQPLPTNITVNKASDTTFRKVDEESETLTWYDSSANSNTTLSSGTDYVSYYDVGKFDVQSSTTLADYNKSDGDKIYVDYTAVKDDTTAQQGVNDSTQGLSELSGFLPIIGLVVAAAVVIGLVSGGFTGGGRRGRA